MHTPEEERDARELLAAMYEVELWLASKPWPKDVKLGALTGVCVRIIAQVARRQGGIRERMRLYTEGVALLVKDFYESVS